MISNYIIQQYKNKKNDSKPRLQLWPVAIVCPGTVWFIPWDAAAWGGGARHEGRHLLVSLWSHGGLRQLLARCPVSPLPLQTGWGKLVSSMGFLCCGCNKTPPREARTNGARLRMPPAKLPSQPAFYNRKLMFELAKSGGHFSAECFGLALLYNNALFGFVWKLEPRVSSSSSSSSRWEVCIVMEGRK